MQGAHNQQILGNQAAADIHGDDKHHGKQLLEDKVPPAQDIGKHRGSNDAKHGSDYSPCNGNHQRPKNAAFLEYIVIIVQCKLAWNDKVDIPQRIRRIVKRNRQYIQERI